MTCTAAAVAGVLAHGATAAQPEEQAIIETAVLSESTVTAPADEPATIVIETAELPAALEDTRVEISASTSRVFDPFQINEPGLSARLKVNARL